jgi:hypothetical protein
MNAMEAHKVVIAALEQYGFASEDAQQVVQILKERRKPKYARLTGGVIGFTDVVCVRETEKAIHCEIGDELYWIPKTHVNELSQVQGLGATGTLIVSKWIADQKGLIKND